MNKIALVIGNSEYINSGSLRNPKNDANDIADVLIGLGFNVIKVLNGTHTEMMIHIKDFMKKAIDYSATFFYYAGHGMQIDGNNYIIPTDFILTDKASAILNSYCMNDYLNDISLYKDKTNIIVLDACRDNPFSNNSRGIINPGFSSFAQAPKGSFISFSTSPDNTASDGMGDNGLYTGILKEYLKTPNVKIEDIFKMVRTKLDQVSGGSQMSWEHSSLLGDFYFLVNELNTEVTQIEVYEFIKSQGDMYEAQGDKDIYEIECLPYLDAQKKFALPIIELLRLYSKESYTRMGQRFTDSDIDEINIGYLSSWGFKYKNYRWYFKDEYVVMGDPLPLDESRREQLPVEGYEIDVNLVAKCYFEDDKMFIDVVHNLPNKTKLMLSLRNRKEAYFAQSKAFCGNNFAKSEGFTNKGSKLKDGLYQLCISSPIYRVQDKEAKLALGEGNRNLIGRNVKHSPIGGKTVDGHFSIVIEGNNIKVFD